MRNPEETNRKLREIKRLFRRTYRWFTKTRRRKILSSILAILIVLTSIRFAFFNKPKQVLAAKMEITENDDSITIDVSRRYRAILQKGDTDDFMVFYDRYENNQVPVKVLELKGAYIYDGTPTQYRLRWDDNRITTLLESTSSRVVVRIEGCFDTTGGGACIKDVDGDNDEIVQVIETYTFTPEGVFIDYEYDFKEGVDIDSGEWIGSFWPTFNYNTSHSEDVLYSDGATTEGTNNTASTISNATDEYIVIQGTGNYQDIIAGESTLNGNRILSNSDNGQIYRVAIGTPDEISFVDIPNSDPTKGKGRSSFFLIFKPQSELNTQAKRQGVWNDITNPDTLDFTTGDLWDDKPISSGGIATSSAVLFHSGFEGGDSNLCDGGDGWTSGQCDGSNTAVGNETTTVFDDTYSGKFTSVGVIDEAHASYQLTNSSSILHGRVYFRLDYEDLVDTAGLLFMGFVESSTWDNTQLGVRQNGSNLELFVRDETGWSGVGSDGYIQLDTWYCAEMRVYRHDSLGTEEVWLNDKPVYSATSRNTGANDFDWLTAGLTYSGSFNNQIFIDDVVLSQSYIGCAEFNEGQGAYPVDASGSHSEFDMDAGENVSTLVNDATHIDSGETPITVDSTSGFPSAGVAYIEGDKFSYTSTSGTTFIGVPATGELSINYHSDNSVVSLPQRHSPSVKMRGYRDNTLPDEAVLEGERLQKDYDYIADIKPFSASYFADELYMHYSLEDANVDIGAANLACDGSFVPGKYGKGFATNADGDDASVTITEGTDYEGEAGTVEFWYQPYYDFADGNAHNLFSLRYNSSNDINLVKATDDDLTFTITDDGTEHQTEIITSNFPAWNAYDWVHIRVTWDAGEPVATQLRIFVNGVELPHTDDAENDDFDGIFANNPTTLTIGNSTPDWTGEANGIIDEFKLYNTSNAISILAAGGNTGSTDEKLASIDRNSSLAFVDDDADSRGEYMWLGSDSAFSGVNIDLETDGVGSSEDFDWEYWSATAGAWIVLDLTEQETGASEWTADGNFYFTPPPDWVPYSVNGSTDLYYIRGHLEGGSYTTTPVENKVLTDIVTFQYTRYGGTISSENQTFEIPGWASGAPPVAHWKFDAGYGTVAFDAMKGNDLTIKDASWQEESLCVSGKCLHYDGSEDMASRSAQLTELDFKETNSFTLTGWFKHASSVTGTDTLISKYESTGSDGGYKVYMDSSGYVCAGIDDDNTWGPDDPACTTTSYADSKWHHFSAVKTDTTQLDLYIDGNRVAYDDNIAASATLENNDGFYVGADEGGYQNYWDGFIDEVKVYRYARSAEEISADFQQISAERGASAAFGDQQSWLSDGLVGYWKMDESTANTCTGATNDSCDSSGNGNDGAWQADATSATGKFGNGVTFDGTGDYIDISSTSTLNPGTGDFTLAGWANLNDTGATRMIYSDGSGSDDLILIQYFSSAFRANVTDENDNSIDISSTTTPITGTWYHVAAVKKGTTLSLYINGELENTGENASIGNVDVSSGSNAQIGGSGGAVLWDGELDEVRTYNRALTPAEVQKLYKWAPGPFGYYSMDEGMGTTNAYDYSGNNNHGALVSITEDSWINGKFGKALTFDGANDVVNLYSSGFNDDFMPKQGTISVWAKVSDVGVWTDSNDRAIIYLGSDYQNNIRIIKTNGNSFKTIYETTDVSEGYTHTTNSTTDWFHVAISWDQAADEVKHYFNGELMETDTGIIDWVGTDLSSTLTNFGGRSSSGTSFPWKGDIDDVRVYNYARTQEQIVSNMNAGHPAPGSPIGSAIAEWGFDEGYGTTANDRTSNNNDLTLSAAAWTNSGKFGKAWDGNGTVTMNNGGDDADFDFSETDDFTISGWFQHDTISTNPDYIFVKAQAGTNAGYKIYMAGDGDIVFEFDDDATWDPDDQLTTTAATYDDNSWHHFVAVKDDTTAAYLYIDGVLIEKDVSIASTATLANDDTLYVGVDDNGSSNPFDGQLDELKVYRFALTQDQVNILYNQGKAAVFGSLSTDSNLSPSSSHLDSYCPPGQGSSCTAPVAEWKFDEKNGTDANDTSENPNTGTLTNGSEWRHAGDCHEGGCLKFDGSNDYVAVGNNSSIDLTSTLTISAWFKPGGDNGRDFVPIIDRQESSGDSYFFGFNASNKLHFGTSGGNIQSTQTSWNNNEWYHFVATYQSSGLNGKLYINGKEETLSVDSLDTMAGGTINTYIGYRPASSEYIVGSIDQVRIYDYVRTPAQIAWSYNRGGPVGWWKLDECSGETAYDSSGNENNGTITIGATGDYTSVGTCSSGSGTEAWNAGTTGKWNASLGFDGTDDYVDMNDIAMLDFNDVDFSIAGWFNRETFTTDDTIVAKRNGIANTDQGYIVYIDDATDKLTFEVCDAISGCDEYQLESTSAFTSTGWNHFVIVWDDDSVTNTTAYINGVKENVARTGALSNVVDLSNSVDFRIGGESDTATATPFAGELDDIRVYNYALTQQQINDIYNSGAVHFGD